MKYKTVQIYAPNLLWRIFANRPLVNVLLFFCRSDRMTLGLFIYDVIDSAPLDFDHGRYFRRLDQIMRDKEYRTVS